MVDFLDTHPAFKQLAAALPFDEYRKLAVRTNLYPEDSYWPAMLALELGSETGEVLDVLKHHYRDGESLDVLNLEKELGDVLWAVALIATSAGLSLEKIARRNLDKLAKRQAEDKLTGSGDDR